jgi:DTW domain-containing protein YfiP
MQAMSIESPRAVCYRCMRPEVICLCWFITARDTRTRFVLLMHPMEFKKEKNGTGRATHLSLSNSEIIVGVDFSEDPRVNALIDEPGHDCRLIYPGTSALNLSRQDYRPAPGKKPVLFLIDATWPCAKKMMRLSDNLQELPRISFDDGRPSEFFIKQQPDPMCLSTVETVHRVLEFFGASGLEEFDENSGRQLLLPFRSMIEIQIRYAANPPASSYRPSGGYRDPSQRNRSVKHSRRNVV